MGDAEQAQAQEESLRRHRKALLDVLGADGLELVEMPPDGNCQFHALADQIGYACILPQA